MKGRKVKGMPGRQGVLWLALAAAVVVSGGTTWAIGQDEGTSPWPAPPTGVLATGTAPSKSSYEIAAIDPKTVDVDPSEAFCFQIRTEDGGEQVGRSQGCAPTVEAIGGQEMRPSYTLLGADRFFTMLAPEGVTSMEVEVKNAAGTALARSQALDAGELGKLLVVITGGPRVTSRDPSTFQDYEIRLLDGSGKTVDAIPMGDLR